MSSNVIINVKKKALLAHKDKILEDIKYYEKRIEDFGANAKSLYLEDADSSDSDNDFPKNIDINPSLVQLKLEQSMLKTCLQATQELTNLIILQSEINIMVEDPAMVKEPLVKEQGTWREVTAECRIDFVPFSITFHIHQPCRPFGQTSYRGLHVMPVKSAHESELAKSVLPSLTRPSDAIEVLRSYAVAFRSRRTTLSELVETYGDTFIEAIAEGGYVLKCANLLEVSWWLENKWSPVAPFHHRMKFEVEYMDESYIKIITQAHKQLSDPSIDTKERTKLLSKIISTCLDAQGPTQELYESMESDPESIHRLTKRRTTLGEQQGAPVTKKHKDSEMMAPPKSLPKKSKPKGKENSSDNRKSEARAVKRVNTDDNEGRVKKVKSSDRIADNENESAKLNKKETAKVRTKPNSEHKKNYIAIDQAKNVCRTKDNVYSGNKVDNSTKIKDKDIEPTQLNSLQEPMESDQKNANVKKKTNDITSSNKAKNIPSKNVVEKSKNSIHYQNPINLNVNAETLIKIAKDSVNNAVNKKNSVNNINKPLEKKTLINNSDSKKSEVEADNVEKKTVNTAKNAVTVKNSSGKRIQNLANKGKVVNKNSNTISLTDLQKNNNHTNELNKDINIQKIKSFDSSKNLQKAKNPVAKGQSQEKQPDITNKNKKTVTKPSADRNLNCNIVQKQSKVNNVATSKNKDNLNKILKIKNVANANEINIPQKEIQIEKDLNTVDTINKIVIKNLSHKNMSAKNKLPKMQRKPKLSSGSAVKKFQPGSTDMLEQKISKIPQKKLSPLSETSLKKNPLRISPRKLPSKFKSPLESNNQKVQKLSTNIPRLMKKPTPKTMNT